jgi:hypothetical protein
MGLIADLRRQTAVLPLPHPHIASFDLTIEQAASEIAPIESAPGCALLGRTDTSALGAKQLSALR